jgi:site-specific DNA-methyltransferase (adenine-specific)
MPGPTTYSLAKYQDKVLAGDCLELMTHLPDSCIDLVLCDLPYGTTRNKWDSVIDLDLLWEAYHRVAKPTTPIVLTSAQPFTSALVMSNPSEFKVEWIWSKTVGSGQLNIKHQPLRTHESVLVFYRKKPVYHPQMTDGTPYAFTRKATYEGPGYNAQRDVEVANLGVRYPKTVLDIANPRIKGGHPTQKPLALFEYLIRTYSDPGALVLDNTIGSGTTAVAAINTGRHFVGMELDSTYVTMARAAITSARRAQRTKK